MGATQVEGSPPTTTSSPGRLLVASAGAGVVATAISHPLDTWAIHRMVGKPLHLSPANLYRGIGPACLQAVAIYGAMLGSFAVMREHLGYSMVVSAMVAAVPEGLVKGPLEALKNLRQTKTPVSGRVLAVGTVGMLCRELPGNVAYFGAYEAVRG